MGVHPLESDGAPCSPIRPRFRSWGVVCLEPVVSEPEPSRSTLQRRTDISMNRHEWASLPSNRHSAKFSHFGSPGESIIHTSTSLSCEAFVCYKGSHSIKDQTVLRAMGWPPDCVKIGWM